MMDSEPCPVCKGPLHRPQQVDVCHQCHRTFQLDGLVSVTTTGEFSALCQPSHSRTESLSGSATEKGVAPVVRCCWCSRAQDEVKKLLSQGQYHICNECVALCAEILRLELGS